MASKTSGLIAQVNPNGTVYNVASTAYGYCQTAADTAAKIVDMTGFTLIEGITIHVKFQYANTAANPTLNVNGTGAKSIKLYGDTAAGTNAETTGWQANSIVSLTYDGTSWIKNQGYNTNTTYSAASTSTNGLMTSAMVTKLNDITESADSVSVSASLTTGSKIGTITVNGTETDLYQTWTPLSTASSGYVPVAPNDTSKFLCGDGTWATPQGEVYTFTSGINAITVNPSTSTSYDVAVIPTIFYGECTTLGETVEKIVNDVPNFHLTTGVVINIKFTNSNTAANPTLNINNTGALLIKAYGTTSITNSTVLSEWKAGSIVSFIYDGTYWIEQNDIHQVMSRIATYQYTNNYYRGVYGINGGFVPSLSTSIVGSNFTSASSAVNLAAAYASSRYLTGTGWQAFPSIITSMTISTATTGQATISRTLRYSTGTVSTSTTTFTAATFGLGNVENVALSTWPGSTAITTLGTITTGTIPWDNISDIPVASTSADGIMTSTMATTLNNVAGRTVTAGTGISITGNSTNLGGSTGAITITNAGVREISFDNNQLNVNTNGTVTGLTIGYALAAGSADYATSADSATSASSAAYATSAGSATTATTAAYATSAGTATSATSATSATKATQDSDGNVIKDTYLKLSGGTLTNYCNMRHTYAKSSALTTAMNRGIYFLEGATTGTAIANRLGLLYNNITTGGVSHMRLYAYDPTAGSSAACYFGPGYVASGPVKRTYTDCQVYGAVWNDYAEYRKDNLEESELQKPGRCVKEIGDGRLTLTTQRLERGCEIISDTFGFAIGQDEENGYNTPIASNGRVLAYIFEGREAAANHIGWPVCSGPNGTVSIMTAQEEERYPSRIIGTISEIPDYEEWGEIPVKVNDRIWIRVR